MMLMKKRRSESLLAKHYDAYKKNSVTRDYIKKTEEVIIYIL